MIWELIKLVTRMGAGSVQKFQSEGLREEAEDGLEVATRSSSHLQAQGA